MRNKTKHIAIIICVAVIAALTTLSGGCGGGGGGGASAPAPAAAPVSKTGFGKVSAVVKLTPPAGREAGSTSATVTVSISISGVYKVTNEDFAPVESSSVIDYGAGAANISMLNVPVGVNHLITIVADWGGYSSETLKAVIPAVEDGESAPVTVDHVSTAVANAALYITGLEKTRLADFDPDDMAILQEGVAAMAKNNPSYYTMTGEQIVAYVAAAGIPAGVTLTPVTATVATGQTYQFSGAQLDLNGSAISGATFTWAFASTASTTVGTVSPTGLFTASAEGSGVLSVTSAGFTATASITVISNCTQDTQCEDGVSTTLDACLYPGTNSATCSHTTIACATNSDCGGAAPVCVSGGAINSLCSACASDTDCNDSNAYTADICSLPATAGASCGHAAIACLANSDCADGVSLTYDSCSNGGAASAACSNTAIACNADADCNDNNFSTTDACLNGGTLAAACSITSTGPAAASVSIGQDHACALQVDGTVKCWGLNINGATGGGFSFGGGGGPARIAGRSASGRMSASENLRNYFSSTFERTPRSRSAARSAANAVDGSMLDLEPVTVVGLTGAVYITAKAGSSCAIVAGGAVQCWGYNSNGQLGDGTLNNSNVPVTVAGVTGAVQIDNNMHTCAVISDGSLKCWGSNIDGQLGDGSNIDSTSPVTVSGLSGNVTQVAVGYGHTCALISDGTVQCWGFNGYGELGDGTINNSLTPLTVPGVSGAVAISAGENHTCALITGGSVLCWGDNVGGQLGDGSTVAALSPVTVSGLSGAAAISAGAYHTCALMPGGSAKCWGASGYGELGVEVTSSMQELLPVTVVNVSGYITGVAAGGYATCFTLSTGVAKCLGVNMYGQLGDGGGLMKTTPTSTYGIAGVTAMSFGSNTACVITTAGSLSCWGNDFYGQLGDGADSIMRVSPVTPTVAGFSAPVGIALGDSHTCAIAPAGTLSCVGYNIEGELGDGTNTTSTAASVQVPGLAGVVGAGGGVSHTCALINDGTVKCWGDNTLGQLGDGTNTSSLSPVAVSGITDATRIALDSTSDHVCAIVTGGAVKCWGFNAYGQLGDGTVNYSNIPVTVSGLTGAVSISINGNSSCAIVAGGEAKCWGMNYNGQLGDGTTMNSSVPVSVSGVTGVASIVLTSMNGCALINDGTVKCWGDNTYGSLGNNSIVSSLTPVSVTGLTDATGLYSGMYAICANSASKGLVCWGMDVIWGGGRGK